MSHYCNNCNCCQNNNDEELLGKSSKNKINEIRGNQVQKLIRKLDIIQNYFVSWLTDELELYNFIINHNNNNNNENSSSCSCGKHGGQEISIINHLKRINAFHDDIDINNNTTIAIELGCGTGRLSDKLQQITNSKLNHILIDRYKFDLKQCRDRIMNQRIIIKKQKSTTSTSTKTETTIIQRIVMDIANLDINQFNNNRKETKEDDNNNNNNNNIFIMSKHLCGPACDLAISAIGRYCCCCCSSCISNSNSNSNSNSSHSNNNKTPTPQPQQPPTVVIATCCHYLCTWESFEGRTMWEILNLTKEDFEVAVAISQWASVKTSSTSTSKTKKRKKTNSKQQQQQQSEEEEKKKKTMQKSSSSSSSSSETTTTTKTATTTSSSRTNTILLPNLLELAKEAGDAVIVAANQKNKTTTKEGQNDDNDSSYLYNIPSDEFERTFSRNSKAKLGRTIKRLLDLSRASKLQQCNYKYVELIRYTTNSIDDRLLVAYNKQINN